MTDQMDSWLREAGDRWRHDPGVMPSLDELLPSSTPRKQRRLPAVVVAAVLVAGLAVTVAVARRPTSSGPAAPEPTSTFVSGRCQDQFHADASFRSKPPYLIIALRLTNTASTACAISAYGPRIDVVDAGGELIASGFDTNLVKITPDQLPVPAGKTAVMSLVWLSLCAPGSDPAGLDLHLGGAQDPDGRGVRVPLSDHTPPTCEPGSTSEVTFHVGNPTLEKPQPTDPCAGLALSVVINSQVTPVPIRRNATHLDAQAPAHILATETGPCADRVGASMWRSDGGDPIDHTGEAWTVTTPGNYVLNFMTPMCQPHQPQCLGGIADLSTVTITVS